MYVLPNEKILVAGTVSTNGDTNDDILLLRYNSDGLLDVDFGNGGFLFFDLDGQKDVARTMAVQPDGKILVNGWTFIDGKPYGLLCRFKENGELDESFASEGAIVSSDTLLPFVKPDMMLGEVGKIYWCLGTAAHPISVTCFLPNGEVDTSFGVFGEAFYTPFALLSLINETWVRLPDGKIAALLGSKVYSDMVGSPPSYYPLMVTISSDGNAINSYTGANFNITYLNHAIPFDDGIAIAGKAISKVDYVGKLDFGFGFKGQQSAVPGIHNALALQVDGKLISVGHDNDVMDKSIVVARMNLDGEMDNKFGNYGKAYFNFSPKDDMAYTSAVDADDRILFAGQSGDSLVVARIFGNKQVSQPTPGVDSIFFDFRPNPAVDILSIDYGLPMDGNINLDLLDMYGRLVQTFYSNEPRQAGHYIEPVFVADDIANGTYLLRFQSDNYSKVHKVMLMRK